VLRFLTSSSDLLSRREEDVKEMLDVIDRQGIMPPLSVVQALSRNGMASEEDQGLKHTNPKCRFVMPYLPIVMLALFSTAGLKADISVFGTIIFPSLPLSVDNHIQHRSTDTNAFHIKV
jgi:hypothetical protein